LNDLDEHVTLTDEYICQIFYQFPLKGHAMGSFEFLHLPMVWLGALNGKGCLKRCFMKLQRL
jgi:hypothetical protein